jgi:hypothetical protein
MSASLGVNMSVAGTFEELETVFVEVTVTFTVPQLVVLFPDEQTLTATVPADTPPRIRLDPFMLVETIPILELAET